jgi:FAD/FMN-containing dehydrogenase
LFIGAEGTLGVITAAAIKVFSRPQVVVTTFVAVPNPQAAVALLSRLRAATGDLVSTFELVPRIGIDLVTQHIPKTSDPFDERYDWYVLIEVGGGKHASALRAAMEAELESAMNAGEVLNAVFAESDTQRDALWRLRETIPEAQRLDGASIKHDVSVTTTELPQFIVEGSAAILNVVPRGRIVAYGHLGDGNLHFNVNQPHGEPAAAFLALAPRINRAVHDLIARYGGSFSAEHGIGQLKRDELLHYKSPTAIELMRSIKQALDPNGIMNPGKVI